MEIIEVKAPCIEEKYLKRAKEISKNLEYDNEIFFVKEIKENKLYCFKGTFSLMLAFIENKKPPYKALSISAIVESKDGFIFSIQNYKKKKVIEKGKITVSLGGLVEKDIMDDLYKEMEEELGLKKEHISSIEFITIGEDLSTLNLSFHVKTPLSFKEVKALWKNAKDSWEALELLLFKDLKDLKKEKMSNILASAVEKLREKHEN